MSKFNDINTLQTNTFDEDRYSRQSYTIGKDVMTKLSEAKILVIGYNILGQEIVKNLALQGISQIDICFNLKLDNYQKTGLYYFVENLDLPLDDIQKLNPTIEINQINIFNNKNEIELEKIKKYNLIIIINNNFDDAIILNKF